MTAEAGPSRSSGQGQVVSLPLPAPVPMLPNGKQKAVEVPEHNKLVGFAAGIFSGWTKLAVGHPFDSIKTRMQCAPASQYKGAADCFMQLVRREGIWAVYKGAATPAVGWGMTDAILMGSLHNYRNLLLKRGFDQPIPGQEGRRLSLLGHSIAGLGAGWSNSFLAHPIETIKCKLQLQMARPGEPKIYKNPFDVIRQTVATQGVLGMWRGFGASLIYRSNFAWMFGSFEVFNRLFKSLDGTKWAMSTGTANFIAGGMASNVYWLCSLPFDNVKNRIMTDSLTKPRYRGVYHTFITIVTEPRRADKGIAWNTLATTKNFYKGFIPVVLRAFPTNAAALAVWEGVMRWSKAK